MGSIGIDLGTTHSLIATYEDGSANLIPNVHGEFLTPSVISVDGDQILIGAPARERLVSHPQFTIHAFKRLMGSDKRINLGSHHFRAEELSALVLGRLKEDAEVYLGNPVTEAVISVPAYFNDIQRNATRQAAELAGIQVLRLVNEPTAASLVYGIHESDEKNILILDIGGGTFDVTILELFEGVFEVHASAGDNHLGGEDFTEVICNWLTSIESVKASKTGSSELYALAESAKKALSDSDKVEIKINDTIRVSLDTIQFEDICSALVKRIRQPVIGAVKDAGLTPADFDEILLVGGSSRMPLFRQFVTRLFGRFPQSRENPDHVVAKGAAIQAGLLKQGKGLEELVLTDVMPYSLGVNVYNESNPTREFFHPIIERNQTIPLSRIEEFAPINDEQTELEFGIYQGESRYAENNVRLGSLSMKFPKAQRNKTVGVRFSYDNNGILEIEAGSVTDAANKVELLIQQRPGQMSPDQVSVALAKLDKMKIHPRDLSVNQTLLARAERLYEQGLSDERHQVAELIAYFEQALASQDLHRIARARKEIQDMLDNMDQGNWF